MTTELKSGIVQKGTDSTIESLLGYFSGLGFLIWVYKVIDIDSIKTFGRIDYNILGLPLTIYCKGVGNITDFCQIGKIEEMWFRKKVYIFDDNHLWIEKNFSISKGFNFIKTVNGD